VLVLQDPTNEQSTYLLESLLDAFRSANKVAGAFAFASAAGVRLLTEDGAFREVARNHCVDLVIGIDAVTNVRALDSLLDAASGYPRFSVRAFLNPRPGALFHPKFCWCRTCTGCQLITGSGNLTEGGLLGNWEAYSLENLAQDESSSVEALWNSWTTQHHRSLLPLDNPEVRERASQNTVLAPEGDLPTLVAPPSMAPASEGEPSAAQFFPNQAVVLVAEIPRSGNRWQQANFDLDNYLNFFGAQVGTQRLVIFRHVNGDGTMADYERNRPSVEVRSRNFRFELAAASGVPYPSNGRPIGVFVRVATRTFFYRLLLPSDPDYALVSSLLQRRVPPRFSPQRMRRVRITVEDLRREWPNAPFWTLPATF